MNKKIKNIFWVLGVALVVISATSTSALALDWSAGVDSDGNFSIGIGSEGSNNGGFAMPGSFGLPDGTILGIIENLLFWLLTLFGLVGIIGFVISGIMYLVAAGDSGLIDRAKTGMKYSIVGIIVGLSGFIVLQAVNMWLGGSDVF